MVEGSEIEKMRKQHYVVGQHHDDYAVILDEIDSNTGKVLHQSVVLVGFKSAADAQKHIDTMATPDR
jgi:hypothetical protein